MKRTYWRTCWAKLRDTRKPLAEIQRGLKLKRGPVHDLVDVDTKWNDEFQRTLAEMRQRPVREQRERAERAEEERDAWQLNYAGEQARAEKAEAELARQRERFQGIERRGYEIGQRLRDAVGQKRKLQELIGEAQNRIKSLVAAVEDEQLAHACEDGPHPAVAIARAWLDRAEAETP